jgi:regulatory protein
VLRIGIARMSTGKPRETPDAYRQALGLLVRREHSQHELRRKLAARGADVEQARAALDVLARQGYQDDARFAEMLVRTRLGGGYGPMHIRAELGTHGIASDLIASTLAEAEPDWTALAREALRRRYGQRPVRDRADTLKRGHFLQRRGFDAATIRAALQPEAQD